jgi:glycogen debranching enzyme
MIYVSSWLLNYMIMLNQSAGLRRKESEELNGTLSFLIPFLSRGINYLLSRDVDGDGLLEQNYNEDWMDTVLRDGKIVYSQACWLLGLSSFAKLLYNMNEDKKAKGLLSKACELIDSIEAKMWSEKNTCYMDVNSDRTLCDGSTDILYQDTIFYLFAITEQFPDMIPVSSENLNIQSYSQITRNRELSNIVNNAEKVQERMIMSLQSLKDRVWLRDIPLITEKPLQKTGPWILQAHEYHNYTHWPWITAIELLTRFRCGQINECNILLSNLFRNNGGSKNGKDKIFYEWVDPSTMAGGGAYPFRTGVSAYRLAAFEIISNHTV